MASKREIIKLKSEESSEFYTTTKNKSQNPERLVVKKYDKKVRRHVVFKESKS
jgi:large subunit ribosomal protein L33